MKLKSFPDMTKLLLLFFLYFITARLGLKMDAINGFATLVWPPTGFALAGAHVEIANNGREAIEKMDRDQYDLLLMDLQMPVMDGYEATETLRSSGYKKPIIALTAHALKEERLRCLASGFNDHIDKPVNRHTLLDSIVHQCRPHA